MTHVMVIQGRELSAEDIGLIQGLLANIGTGAKPDLAKRGRRGMADLLPKPPRCCQEETPNPFSSSAWDGLPGTMDRSGIQTHDVGALCRGRGGRFRGGLSGARVPLVSLVRQTKQTR